MKKFVILLVLVMWAAATSAMVQMQIAQFAQASQHNQILIPFGREDVEHLPSVGTEVVVIDGKTVTKGFGVTGFRAIFKTVGEYLSLVLGSVALLMLFVAGYQLVTAQGSISEEKEKQKMNVVYIVTGLIVVGVSSTVVYNFIFKDAGDEGLGGLLLEKESAIGLANETVAYMKRLLNLFLSFSGAGAILMLVITSLRLIINPGGEDQIESQKKIVGYTAAGIIIIGLADTVVNKILFAEGGTKGVQVEILNLELQGLSNYILGFLGVIVFATFVISGVMMVVNAGNEEITGKVKSTLKNVVIGAIVSFSAYTIVATLLETFLAG